MQITLKKQTVETFKSILAGSRVIEYFDKYVNHLSDFPEGSILEAFKDLDNNTDTWGEMFRVLGAFLQDEIQEAPTDKVLVVIG